RGGRGGSILKANRIVPPCPPCPPWFTGLWHTPTPPDLFVFFAERLDLHVHACRQIQLHQRVDGLRRRLEDVDEPLVGADLELLARFLVDVRRPQHRPLVFRRRQRDRTRQPRTGALRGVDDFGRRLIEHPVVVRFQANPDLVAERMGHLPLLVTCRASSRRLPRRRSAAPARTDRSASNTWRA